ncbi:hypothetical protein KC19_9G116200 [Ceratodon purpureus]|uniref:Uncharacterized protein n=1 Tax=Ceratodon purpureus TaxID=3225 RepID=A0A8T0GR16_CERPU|nr:hypothetical protein KC19_9G116200 [Ceratodon purpureus]
MMVSVNKVVGKYDLGRVLILVQSESEGSGHYVWICDTMLTVPARQWSIWGRMSRCKVEKDANFSGRRNLRSAGDGNTREEGELYTGKKRKVDEAPNSRFDDGHGSGVESEALTGSECKGFAPQHGADSLPSFRRPMKSVVRDGRLEIPASFVRTHGLRFEDDVKVQGIHQESPVYSQRMEGLFPSWVENVFESKWAPGRSRA